MAADPQVEQASGCLFLNSAALADAELRRRKSKENRLKPVLLSIIAPGWA